MYPFLKNLKQKYDFNIAVRSISSIIQDVSGNIFNLVRNLSLYLLTVYTGPDWQFHFYCFFYYKQLL